MNGWRPARVLAVRPESASARTLVLQVPSWPGHLAGQHLDVRLTAPDGYQAVRSYSIASPARGPGPAEVEIGVELAVDGEVSSFLTGEVRAGDVLEVTGALGGWFVWRPGDPAPVQLIGGGSGVVPLVSVVRTHAGVLDAPELRLLASVRSPAAAMYAAEVARFDVVWTREVPPGATRPPGRLDAELLAATTIPAASSPTCLVCGPTPFVEHVAELLVGLGHDGGRIRTERFGSAR